tara:strand:- start:266 stop:2203 length:1938 start_codon:yes stop_codon:yes gene_type:complete
MGKTLQFRKDLNGLRAIAVVSVVLFHFNSAWLPGGYIGVDVFFVISGYLMTGIIFSGLEKQDFSILKFYLARADRIVPALAVLCLVMIVFGWIYLTPLDYKILAKHIVSSLTFSSNMAYYGESGYFDVSSHEKWLLHTWSLSVEWQFYVLYPLVLVFLHKFLSLSKMKIVILLSTILGFIFSASVTPIWPDASYFLLPTRAWEMMVGGVAYLYPFKYASLVKSILEKVGLLLIFLSCFLISDANFWPGYLALLPVIGTFMVIQAQKNDSLLTTNFVSQKLGSWSYSIYLWHWPLVAGIYYFKLSYIYIFGGLTLSLIFGFLSFKYIERIKASHNFRNPYSIFLKDRTVSLIFLSLILSGVIFLERGFIKSAPIDYQNIINSSKASPLRSKCHIYEYKKPELACEYFGSKISWAVFGDSHTIEIAYTLADKLREYDIGLKHFSFSACKPSYLEDNNFSKCSKWYNETTDYLLRQDSIKNVVFNHRFTSALFYYDMNNYPNKSVSKSTSETLNLIDNIDNLIIKLASVKENVYVFYPIPELPKTIHKLAGDQLLKNEKLSNITGTSFKWYRERNKYIIDHFDNKNYPDNVYLLKTEDIFCDKEYCFAVRNGIPLYFDDDHPSVLSAEKLANKIIAKNKKNSKNCCLL